MVTNRAARNVTMTLAVWGATFRAHDGRQSSPSMSSAPGQAELERQLVHAVEELQRDIAFRERWIGHCFALVIAAGVSRRRIMEITGCGVRMVKVRVETWARVVDRDA